MVAWQIKSSETQGQIVASGESQTGESGADESLQERARTNERGLSFILVNVESFSLLSPV